MAAFKDKFLAELAKLKGDRAALEQRLRESEERGRRNETTSRTEQRLVLAALYELGGAVFDRNLSGGDRGGGGGSAGGSKRPSKAPSTFLGTQTAAQLRGLDAQFMAGGAVVGTPGTLSPQLSLLRSPS